jgi:hypothetical protein
VRERSGALGDLLLAGQVGGRMTRARWALAVAVAAVGPLAACSSSSAAAPDPATLTGVASPCVGVTTSDQYVQMKVNVTLSANSRTVASQTVTGTHTYRFQVSPGQYRVSSDQPYAAPEDVTLRAGSTTNVDLDPHCK